MKIIQLISIRFEMKNIGIIVYGRFPTEKAYGSHIIDIADGFLENNCNVNVFYSKTSNKKTLDVSPREYYENKQITCKNFDINMETNKAIAYNKLVILVFPVLFLGWIKIVLFLLGKKILKWF